MTRTTNARLAGVTYLLYIALALPSMILFDKATRGQTIAAKLVSIAQHAVDVRVAMVLSLVTCFTALVLAVTLYAITRDVDPDLAMIALACRVGEGIINAIFVLAALGLLWLAATAGVDAPAPAAAEALSALILKLQGWNTLISATFFAVGSTLFSYLLLRGRAIPVPLAWLGVFASLVVVVGLPLQLAGVIRGAMTSAMWLPMLAFEVPLGFWLLIKGVRTQGTQ